MAWMKMMIWMKGQHTNVIIIEIILILCHKWQQTVVFFFSNHKFEKNSIEFCITRQFKLYGKM